MKTSSEILDGILDKVILLRQWASELTTFQRYLIQEAEDALQEVIDKVGGTEWKSPLNRVGCEKLRHGKIDAESKERLQSQRSMRSWIAMGVLVVVFLGQNVYRLLEKYMARAWNLTQMAIHEL